MHRRAPLLQLRLALHRSRLLQIATLCAFWTLGEALVRVSGLPVPGGVVGMAIVLALLLGGWLRPASVRRGAYWLLAEMLLFFIPAAMAVMQHGEFLGALGLKLLAVIVAGTVLVMGTTALTVDLCYRWHLRRMGTP